jgi:hypothetical protein
MLTLDGAASSNAVRAWWLRAFVRVSSVCLA